MFFFNSRLSPIRCLNKNQALSFKNLVDGLQTFFSKFLALALHTKESALKSILIVFNIIESILQSFFSIYFESVWCINNVYESHTVAMQNIYEMNQI